jgi:hypothetical protein
MNGPDGFSGPNRVKGLPGFATGPFFDCHSPASESARLKAQNGAAANPDG